MAGLTPPLTRLLYGWVYAPARGGSAAALGARSVP